MPAAAIVDGDYAVAAAKTCTGGRLGLDVEYYIRYELGVEIFVLLLFPYLDQLLHGQSEAYPLAAALDYDLTVGIGYQKRLQYLVDVDRLATVDRYDAVAVLESESVPRLVEGVAVDHVVVGVVGASPRIQYARVYHYGQQDVHQYAGQHDYKPLPRRLGAELPRLYGLFHLFGVHALVDHAGDLHVAAERQPAHAVLGVSAAELEEREPRVEEYVELLHPYAEYASRDEVAELVYEHQQRQAG